MSPRFIVVSSFYSKTSTISNIVNILPNPPLKLFYGTKIALIDLSIPIYENIDDESMKESVVTFPTDSTRNECFVTASTSSLDDINHEVSLIVSKKVIPNFKSAVGKFDIMDMSNAQNADYYGLSKTKNEIWFEPTAEPDHSTYQPPILYRDPHENVVYQVPGYFNGNSPIFINLSESFLATHTYGGMVFSPQENVDRVKYFSRWKFCRRELGVPFPPQKASKPLIQALNLSESKAVYRIPPLSNDEHFKDEETRRTKEIDVCCNLIETSEGNVRQIMDTLVIYPDLLSASFGGLHRLNVRITDPKYHHVKAGIVSKIQLQIKERKSQQLFSIDKGEIFATLCLK